MPDASSNGDLRRLDPATLAVHVIFDGSFPVHRERVGVSPEGSSVALSQVFGIFVRRIDGSPVPKGPSGPLGRPGDGDVSFTPDGASIVYRCSGSALCRTPVAGGPRTPIAGTIDGDTKPEVSPDGTRWHQRSPCSRHHRPLSERSPMLKEASRRAWTVPRRER